MPDGPSSEILHPSIIDLITEPAQQPAMMLSSNASKLILSLACYLCSLSQAWVIPASTRVSSRCPLALTEPSSAHQETGSSRRDWLSQSLGTVGGLLVVATGSAPPALASEVVSTKRTCDVSVSVWKQPASGRKVYLVGTAHISSSSAVLAGDVIDDVRPDAVFVELDAKRVTIKPEAGTSSSSNPKSASETSSGRGVALSAAPKELIKGPAMQEPPSVTPPKKGGGGMSVALGAAAVGTAIKGVYGNLNKQGFDAGQEFVVAVQEGQKVGAQVILGDRDVDVTLRRLSEALRATDIGALLSTDSELESSMSQLMPPDQLPSNSANDHFKDEMTVYVETMKAKENVKLVMSQLQKAAPEIYQALVAERDAYMANGLNQLNAFPVIVAVMGIAHVDGVETFLKDQGWVPARLSC